MRKAHRHVFTVMTRAIILIVPDDQAAGIVASGAIGFGMPRVFFRTIPDCRIVAVGAFGRRTMRAVTAGAFPALVRGRYVLFFDHLKAVTTFVTLGAQIGYAFHRLVLFGGLIPKRDARQVRVACRLMAHITADIFPIALNYGTPLSNSGRGAPGSRLHAAQSRDWATAGMFSSQFLGDLHRAQVVFAPIP